MIRIVIAVFAAALWATASLAAGSDFERALLSRIESEGYRISSVKTTWLGRVKIDSSNNRNRRQTVYNPVNNAILQDLVIPLGSDTFFETLGALLEGDKRARSNDKGSGKVASGSGGTHDKAGGNKAGGGNDNPGGGNDKAGSGNDKTGGGSGKAGGGNDKAGGKPDKAGGKPDKADGGKSGNRQGKGQKGNNGSKK